MPGSEYVIKYISDLTEATSGAKQVERVNADMAKTLSSDFKQATRVIGTSLNKVSDTPIKLKGGEKAIKTVSQLGTVIQTSDGSFKEFTKTQTFVNGQLTKTAGSLKDVTGQFGRTNVETAKAQKNFVSLSENIGRLAKRALITIPVWLALRGAIMGTFRVIRDGLKTIEEQDRAFQKAKRTLQGTSSEIARNFDKLRESVTKLSIDTGESVEKITNAFYKFSTVGFDFETAMQGAEYATKTAIIMFGDAEETANAFARAMKVLVDRSADAKPAGEQIAEAMALTSELWKTNAFELNEFTNSLEKFAGTAKATNFTTRQTIALLSTLSSAGLRERGGRLLRTSILKLLQNLDKLGSTLGVKVNPQLDSTFDVLMKVLDGLEGLDEGSQVAQQTASVLSQIFGGARGSEVILALKALREEMLKNAQAVGGIDKLDESFEEVNKTISRLITQFHNLNKEIGKTLLQGITGTEEFVDSMEKIVEMWKIIHQNTEIFGRGLRTAFKIGTLQFGNLKNEFQAIDKIKLSKFKKEIEDLFNLSEIVDAGIIEDLLKNIETAIPTGLLGYTKQFQAEVKKALEERLKILNEIAEKEKEIAQKGKTQAQEPRKLSHPEQQDIAKLVLDIELDRLKALGATNSQLLKATDLYKRQTDLEDQSLDKVKRKLEYEKAVAEEKRLQNRLSEESLQLFRLATGQVEAEEKPKSEFQKIRDEMSNTFSPSIQKENIGQKIGRDAGYEMAKMFGKVLQGELSLENFFRRATQEQIKTFEKLFPGKIESAQAEQFLKGERISGKPELRGGLRIPIEEEAIRGIDISKAIRENLKAQREFIKLETKDMQIVRPEKVEIIGWDRPEELRGALSNEDINRQLNIENVARRVSPGRPITEADIPPIESKIDINFPQGTFTIIGQTKEEQLKEINKAFINLGTPGTKENQQLNKAITGNKQNQVL